MRLQNILMLGGLVALGMYLDQRSAEAERRRVRGRLQTAGKHLARDERGRWIKAEEASDGPSVASDPKEA